MSLSVRADRRLIRAEARSRRFIRIELAAPEAPPRQGRIPVNLAFVLDRSGSMAGDKIARAREAAIQGIRSLRPEDRFAVVSYDQRVEIVVPTTLATPEAKQDAEGRVAAIEERGSTDLHGGWAAGCGEIARALRGDAVGRCLLLTDGLANAGITDRGEIVARVTDERRRRVATSVFGIGADFDEVLLAQMAEAGGGNFHFVEGAAQIPELIAGEVGEALAVTAAEAVLVVEAGEGVIVESLNELPCSHANGAWRIELGSLFAGQRLDPVVRVTFPKGRPGATCDVRVRLEDRESALGNASGTVSFTYASHAENESQERDRVVDRRVAFLFAAQAGRRALDLNRAGRLDEAKRVLQQCIDRIRSYAGDDRELQATIRELEEKLESYSARMDPLSMKARYFAATSSLKMRAGARPQMRRVEPPPPKVVVLVTPGLEHVVRPALAQLAAADPALFGGVPFAIVGRLPESESTLPAGDEVALVCAATPGGAPDAVRVLFTRHRLGDNWFSHWHELRKTAVVSMAEWNGPFRVPPEAFAAYEIVLHALRALAPGFTAEALMHDETRGCLFDFCESRGDVELKLQAGSLCAACRRALAAAGLPAPVVENLLNAVRLLAAAPSVVH